MRADIHYRRATEVDAGGLARFAAESFRDTYGGQFDRSDLEAHVASAFGEKVQRHEIRSPGSDFFVAETDRGEIVGLLHLRQRAPSGCDVGPNPLEVHRIYVSKTWHGRGIGRRLMAVADQEGAAIGADALWLGVWERNEAAIRFYAHEGFREVGSHTFVVGDDAQTDLILARDVRS